MTDLAQMTAFVTGATSGFGLATARLFAAHGARVIAAGRREERLSALKQEFNDRLHTIGLDVRDHQAVNEAVRSLPDEFAEIDVLVNNAGLALGMEPAHEAVMEDWDLMVDTNIKGLLYCTRAILPGMIERRRGHIVNLGSVAGTYPYPGGNVYGGTKAFVRQFSLALRADIQGQNVRVTSIEPAMSDTEFSAVRFHGDTEKAEAVYAGMKALTGEDIAEIIRFVTTLPEHVNVNAMEIMPITQAFAPFAVHRVE